MKALLLAAALAAPHDGEARRALDLVYQGRLDASLQQLARLGQQHPDDPLLAYLQALAMVWKVEQLGTEALDRELLRRVDHAVSLADQRLRAAPRDTRALLARGAAHGVRSRYHFLRLERTGAARAGVRMREDLLRVREMEPENVDAFFGLGLYDYYADVLSPLARVVRFVARMPGGDRRRGLELIGRARGSAWHDVEVQAQLYDIHAFWEQLPDRALAAARALRQRYPGWPLWGLRLCEHLRQRMGLYGESARVAREMLAQGARGEPNYAGASVHRARLELGEALLLDLRLDEARAELAPLAGTPAAAHARLLLGRAAEMAGDRAGALAEYRQAAAAAGDRQLRKRAEQAAARALPAPQVRAVPLLAQARRAREAGQRDAAAQLYRQALQAWPGSEEAAVRVAEAELARGDLAAARRALDTAERPDHPQPPWVAGWALLLRAQLRDLDGQRAAAVSAYKKVLETPYGQDELAGRAADGVRRAFRLSADPPAR
jgi:tetratricopeptide (TPR) repeat protein